MLEVVDKVEDETDDEQQCDDTYGKLCTLTHARVCVFVRVFFFFSTLSFLPNHVHKPTISPQARDLELWDGGDSFGKGLDVPELSLRQAITPINSRFQNKDTDVVENTHRHLFFQVLPPQPMLWLHNLVHVEVLQGAALLTRRVNFKRHFR